MNAIYDPDGIETSILHSVADFRDRRVLEIGCGDGRLTWRYADKTAHITAIDPNSEDIETARAATPGSMKDRVVFVQTTLEEFAASFSGTRFQIALYSWSL